MDNSDSSSSQTGDAASIAASRSASLGGSSRLIPTGAPADLVTLQIIAGSSRTALIPTLEVLGLSVSREVNRLASARIVLVDGDPSKEMFPVSRRPELRPGNDIEILAGYHSTNETIFKGVIVRQRIEATGRGRSQLVLECKHPADALTQSRRSRCFVDETDSEIIESLLREGKQSDRVTKTSLQHEKLVQFDATDWDFILSRAEANGMFAFVEDKDIVIAPPDLEQEPVLDLQYGANILALEIQEEPAPIAKSSEVQASTWDPKEQKVLNSSSEGKTRLQHGGDRTKQELESWTEAEALKSGLSRIRGCICIQGFAEVLPGKIVNLKGIGEGIDGNVFVSGIRHQISAGNWTTDIQIGMSRDWFHQRYPVSATPAGGLVPAVAGLQIGVVSKIVEDPQGESRVQVRLPLTESPDAEIWARVARLDAGVKRGTFFLPEIDDEVVLGFLGGDPRDAIILGMLHSSKKAPPLEATEKNEQKGIVTREKLQLVFDDETKVIELSTPAGNALSLSEADKKISISDQNSNRFEMSPDGIVLEAKGNKIEMTSSGIVVESAGKLGLKATGAAKLEGANIEASAQTQFKAAGNAGAELSSSGITVLKGSLIKIN